MKVVFLARGLDSSRIIADRLLRNGWAEKVVFETGATAKTKKLRRMLRRKPWWKIFLLPLDILFLLFMTRRANSLFYKKFSPIPEVRPDLWVGDANDPECVEFLRKERPDILLIHGTAILKKPVLSAARLGVINLHGGIVPKYRNVHGEFWAVAHGRYDELGTSILVTDEGVDTGDVVKQRTLGLKSPVTVSQAKLLVFEETLKVLDEVMPELRRGTIPRQKQSGSQGPVFQTPGFTDWLRFGVRL